LLFNSFHFLFFFVAVTGLYFLLPHKARCFFLLSSSCYFYIAFVPVYILILLFTIIVDYFAGIFIAKSNNRNRKLFLVCSLVANIGILAIFKYYNFINSNISHLLGQFGYSNPIPYLQILLPIGLSFHTFQAMSYTIEVYRGNQLPERNFGIYALYVMFYPQLVAGPIERPQNLLHQFREVHKFEYDRVASGLRVMLWGFFKKIVIADRLAIVSDKVFAAPHNYNSMGLMIASLFFSFQIFCDFSGYSDIAIGSARIMGFTLMKNFDSPYSSKSLSEFWKRWHISLSTWFKDYLYIPLGGNRVRIPRLYINLFIVFLISGLWHGANWTFIIWGALHGFYLVFGILTEKLRKNLTRILHLKKAMGILSTITTFLLVAFAWIFFKSPTLSIAFYIATHIFSGVPNLIQDIIHHKPLIQYLGMTNFQLKLSFILIVFLSLFYYLKNNTDILKTILRSPVYVRWSIYYIVILLIITLGSFENKQFIYFQF
jgi:alginate O-acetyltransferase complex protein AlgI